MIEHVNIISVSTFQCHARKVNPVTSVVYRGVDRDKRETWVLPRLDSLTCNSKLALSLCGLTLHIDTQSILRIFNMNANRASSLPGVSSAELDQPKSPASDLSQPQLPPSPKPSSEITQFQPVALS